jgi:TolA-binding protein
MIRIICTECKNAYLQNKDGNLVCPSCGATYDKEKENLLLGVQYYNEENYTEADNCFMKHIVKNSLEPLSIFYKSLCDARNFDEDTLSLQDTYKKIINAFDDVSDEDFPKFIALANDEVEKIEKLLCESHIRLFADADAEKIKKQVEIILNIQNEAKTFRTALAALVADFNQRSPRKISAKFSDCFFVEGSVAAEVGDIKYHKICDNVASHTVFTGILTNDIKNLEIYYRCIVMFFQKSYDKYKFLLEQSEKFTKLAEMLELGQYNTIKGTGAVADKLKSISYDFLQESYKEHFDEQIDMQTETVVIIEPEIIEEPEVVEESAQEIIEDVIEDSVEEATEAVELEADSEEEVATEEESFAEETEAPAEETAEIEASEEVTEEIVAPEEDIIEIEVEETSEEIETEVVDISSTAEIEDVSGEEAVEEAEEEIVEEPAEEIVEEDSIVEIPVEASEEEIAEEQKTVEEVVLENVEKIEANEEVINGDDQKDAVVNPKKKKGHKGLILFVLIIVLAGVFAGYKYIPGLIKDYKYDKAVALADSGKYSEAITAFNELGEYSDSQEKALECEYNYALKLEEDGKFAEAKLIFQNLGSYGDASTRVQACAYSEAKDALENKNFKVASKLFMELGDYGDSKEMVKECSYQNALSLIENKEYKSAIEILTAIRKYSDAKDKILEAKYMFVTDNFNMKNKTTVKYLNELTAENYRNSAELRKELLGSSEVMSDDIKAVVNYSATDVETSLTQLDNTKPIYFHAVVGDKSLYGKTLTLKYTTAFGYTQRKTVVLSESDNVAVMSYPATQYKNYTVEFELLDSNGQKIAGQKISF